MANALRSLVLVEQTKIADYILNDETGFAVELNNALPVTFTGKLMHIEGRMFHEISDGMGTTFLACLFDDGSAYVVLDEDEAAQV